MNGINMIVSLLTGRKGSIGFPEKHFCKVGGNYLGYYPMAAARDSKMIDVNYLSTDDERLMDIARENNIEIIERPPSLASNKALSEDVFIHGYNTINQLNEGEDVEIIVLLMCNAATITASMIDEGINVLIDNPDYDSAVSVSSYNMYSPVRARSIGDDGLLHPFIPFNILNSLNVDCNSNRDTQGDVWFADMGVSIVRARCIENIWDGLLPQRWMGHKIFPLKQKMGLDIDYKWQLQQVEEWLKLYGDKPSPVEFDCDGYRLK
jgi:hypothetical protein